MDISKFKYNPFTGKKLDENKEYNNINQFLEDEEIEVSQEDFKDNKNNDISEINNKNFNNNLSEIHNNKDYIELKKLYKYYYYIDSKGLKYKYTLNKIYNNKKIYYSCSDSKCHGVAILSINDKYTEKEKELQSIKEFIPKKINNPYHSILWENHSYNRVIYMQKEFDE